MVIYNIMLWWSYKCLCSPRRIKSPAIKGSNEENKSPLQRRINPPTYHPTRYRSGYHMNEDRQLDNRGIHYYSATIDSQFSKMMTVSTLALGIFVTSLCILSVVVQADRGLMMALLVFGPILAFAPGIIMKTTITRTNMVPFFLIIGEDCLRLQLKNTYSSIRYESIRDFTFLQDQSGLPGNPNPCIVDCSGIIRIRKILLTGSNGRELAQILDDKGIHYNYCERRYWPEEKWTLFK